MKRKKLVSWLIYWQILNFCYCGELLSSAAVTNFQNSLQQQNTISILSSIEERLRNLDNIYSMQLSGNLETKLDQYNKNLENMDNKITRLETLVMTNLGKISENISTKNFKDDMTKTDTLRKLDLIYEGINHRLNYIERKIDTNYVKIQEKMDITVTHLDQIEKEKNKRDADLETELSTVLASVNDLKKDHKTIEQKILNATEENLIMSKHTFNLLTKFNADNRKSMNKLHDNLVVNLQYMDNKTTDHKKISDDTNVLLKQMRIELKEDFNSYANKVADMNSDMWKNTDTTEDDLKNIGIILNSTKTELQNGIRSLMIQIGKISHKEVTGTDYKELESKISTNFEKVLTNQDVFLESCHRLQMDESQIESEISVMLNKLIDMLEKKFASEVKDIKNFEKNLKNHDNRINRNLLQANQNIISLFEKSVVNTDMITSEIKKIGNDLNALFSFVQTTTNDGSSVSSQVILEKLNGIERSTKNLDSIISTQNISNNEIYKEMQNLSKTLTKAIEKLYNTTLHHHGQNTENSFRKQEINETVWKRIEEIFGPNPNITYTQQQKPTIIQQPKPKKKCKQNYSKLIDIRAETSDDCEEISSKTTKKPKRRKMKYDIDIRADLKPNEDDYEETTTENTTTTVSDQL